MRLILLGRDGVINQVVTDGVRTPDEWQAIPGSARAIARLTFAHYHVVLATNQPGVGRGEIDNGALNLIHEKMHNEVGREGGKIDAIFYCPHRPEQACACRKPNPGMLHEIGSRLGIDLQGVPLVGDGAEDVAAARAVGARPILVRSGRGRATERCGEGLEGIEIYDDLSAVVGALLESSGA